MKLTFENWSNWRFSIEAVNHSKGGRVTLRAGRLGLSITRLHLDSAADLAEATYKGSIVAILTLALLLLMK